MTTNKVPDDLPNADGWQVMGKGREVPSPLGIGDQTRNTDGTLLTVAAKEDTPSEAETVRSYLNSLDDSREEMQKKIG